MKHPRGAGLGLAWFMSLVSAWSAADTPGVLWQIGEFDGRNRDLAHAPSRYAEIRTDGFFIPGVSDPARDWPYAQPGPDDAWAGARSHTFTVVFGLAAAPREGEARLALAFLDTHAGSPPRLEVRINDQPFARDLPAGGGDASISGDPTKGRPHRWEIPFPATLLRAGENELTITTVRGSWVLYDALALQVPAGVALAAVRSRTFVDAIEPVRALKQEKGAMVQSVQVRLRHLGDPARVTVRLGGLDSIPVELEPGLQEREFRVPAVRTNTVWRVEVVDAAGRELASREVALRPVPQLTVYILPHSHTDIGYTEIQTDIEKKQVQNLVDGLAQARRTADYPAGSRFVWNVEVLWAADLYLRRLDAAHRAAFLDAVKRGQVALNGMYLNELTGLCRPEELVRLFRYAPQLGRECGVTIDSVMISDVPGYTWGTVTAMAQAGLRYFSTAPNYFDRIGTILREWENKPFYWVGPDGRTEVLVWIPFWGYAMSHRYGRMSPRLVSDLLSGLEQRGYPYDIAHVRWSGHGDNAVPDPSICDFVRDWNAQYAWPRFVIASTSEAFRAFEQRYGGQLPRVRGDWTPYWEDGAGSSALETAMNRASSDRVAQAEALFALQQPRAYPAAEFVEAWNSVLLYSEHTWGADVSVSQPESQKTREQWDIKRGYALDADRQSRALLARALELGAAEVRDAVEVLNTASWPRTELVLIPKELSARGDRVTLPDGTPVSSQRMSGGDLAILVKDLPPFATRRYVVTAGAAMAPSTPVTVRGGLLENGSLRVRVDENTGNVIELSAAGMARNFAGGPDGEPLNEYLYLPGDQLTDLKRSGTAVVRPGLSGPLVASVIAISEAPGCRQLRREVRLVAGMDHVELFNVVDKARLEARSYHAKEGKESVNFAFPFQVPGGDLWLDLPLGAIRPEIDQMPSACKNWFTVGRWADASAADQGITWVTLDAPLLQVGGLTANLLNSQTNPDVWRKTVEPTTRIYSWAMNNHWGTNYRAYQEGEVLFRYVLRPHRRRDLAEASRFATGFSQPLQVRRARGPASSGASRLVVEPADVIVAGFKPSDDGKALILRLFGASGETRQATLRWSDPAPVRVSLSGSDEQVGAAVSGPVTVPGWGLVTLRAERAQ
jgi:hypothetical protein